jgi:S-adenosyl-L-methionine hydrolase (adenosine-forming)
MRVGILTLTTDFGSDGPYVAAMKGIILGLAPGTQLIDVSHAIAPQNILEGAFVLAGIIDAFPPGTVHLAVIDPGVGTDRRMIAALVADQWFVLPDNGLLSGVLQGRTPVGMWEINNPAIRARRVSFTFHGRDIMAPAAAHLLRGGDPAELGPELESIVTLSNFAPRHDGQGILGEVIFRDAFGNLITNVHADRLNPDGPRAWLIEIAGHRVDDFCRTYGDRSPGALIALAGSTGWIEIAVVNGDAARSLSAGPGTTVWFKRNS